MSALAAQHPIDPLAFERWLNRQLGHSARSAADGRRVATQFLSTKSVADLTAQGIESWADALPSGPERRKRCRTHLHRLRDYAQATLPEQLLPAMEPDEKQRRLTIDDFTRWLTDQGTAPTTLKHRRAVANAFIADYPAFLAVPDQVIEKWLDGLNLSRATRSTYLTHLRSLFRWAADQNLPTNARLAPRGGPGTASSVTEYGRGRVLLAVPTTWHRLIQSWIDWMAAAGRPQTTLYLREYQLRRFASDNPLLQALDVTVDDLTAWLASQMWAVETRRSYQAALRGFFGWAHRTGRMSYDPASMLGPITPPRAVARPTPDSVYRRALATQDPRTELMVRLAAHLGLRRAEIAKVHAQDLVEGDHGWTLYVTGKGGHQRQLPVMGETLQQLRAMIALNPEGYVFPGMGGAGHLTPGHVGKVLSELLGKGWTGHTLRHRFGTVVYGASSDLYATQTLLGHASPVTTRRYVQIPDEKMRAAAAAANH